MNITVEAIYEAGILKVLSPLPALPDRTRVRLTIEPEIGNTPLRFSNELLARIDRRRATVFQRCGELSDSNDLIREAREQELA